VTAATDSEDTRTVRLRCPSCKRRFPNDVTASFQLTCPGCGFAILEVNGILRALTHESKAQFERFVRDYELVRAKEGWGSQTADYYLALPFNDLTNKHNSIWRIRARTLLYLQNHVLPKIESADFSGCRVLDIGAGNGWLSYRLAKRGYHPIAIDLLDNDVDGLGAARHYLAYSPQSFLRFQADMDHLPFDSGQFDVAIFNASFHYSSDYERTLREVLRCLRRPGIVVVADSPFYWHEESGKQMLEERRAMFERQFGIRSDINHSREYLTQRSLDELAERLEIQWNVGKPWYGLGWALRPAKARLLRRREPSKFYLLWFKAE
jgi:ubiquinone/menaquinone biosynthesis C-methylase UbiE/DNA-directed RNA polymerase subunit RPC12/RpoP